jgi:hypothetical protein
MNVVDKLFSCGLSWGLVDLRNGWTYILKKNENKPFFKIFHIPETLSHIPDKSCLKLGNSYCT